MAPPQAATKAQTHKVVLFGEVGAGKSALALQLTQDRFTTEYDPTIEDDFTKSIVVDDELARLIVIDTASQEDWGKIWDRDAERGDAFLLVYSIDWRISFERIPVWHSIVMRVKGKDGAKVPIVLVGSKSDLENRREVSPDEGRILAEEFGCPFIETSSKEQINVAEAFHMVVREIRKQNRVVDASSASPQITKPEPREEGSGRCTCVIG